MKILSLQFDREDNETIYYAIEKPLKKIKIF